MSGFAKLFLGLRLALRNVEVGAWARQAIHAQRRAAAKTPAATAATPLPRYIAFIVGAEPECEVDVAVFLAEVALPVAEPLALLEGLAASALEMLSVPQ